MLITAILFSTLILTAEPDQPTEVTGSAATPNGNRKDVTIFQPENMENPFGYVAPELNGEPTVINGDATPNNKETSSSVTPAVLPQTIEPLVSQSSTTNPQEMSNNPLDYQDKIENTIYQSGNRLIDVQSVPIQDINKALTPNIQPTISDYPAF